MTVGSRFHGTALVHELLQLLDGWRVVVPPRLVRQGYSKCWTSDAPSVDVAALAVARGLR